jgi:hypothetical protein
MGRTRPRRIAIRPLLVTTLVALCLVPGVSLATAAPARGDSFVEGFSAHTQTSYTVGRAVTNSVAITWQNSTSTPMTKTLTSVELIPTCAAKTVFNEVTHVLACRAPDGANLVVLSAAGAQSCAGRTFAANLVDMATWKWQLVANDNKGPVSYTSASNVIATCEIDFVVVAVKRPATDMQPATPLIQSRYGISAVDTDNTFGISDGGSVDVGITVGP